MPRPPRESVQHLLLESPHQDALASPDPNTHDALSLGQRIHALPVFESIATDAGGEIRY